MLSRKETINSEGRQCLRTKTGRYSWKNSQLPVGGEEPASYIYTEFQYAPGKEKNQGREKEQTVSQTTVKEKT